MPWIATLLEDPVINGSIVRAKLRVTRSDSSEYSASHEMALTVADIKARAQRDSLQPKAAALAMLKEQLRELRRSEEPDVDPSPPDVSRIAGTEITEAA
ncbi:MAG: hypothetical protein ACE5JS_08780 [Nitrospinota bacterium]